MMDEIDIVSAAEVEDFKMVNAAEVEDFKVINAVEVDELKQEILSPLRETQSDPEDMVHADIKIEDSVDLEFFESPELETAPSISYDDDAASPIIEKSEPSSPSTTTSSPKTKRRKTQTTTKKKNENPFKRIELLERHSVEQASPNKQFTLSPTEEAAPNLLQLNSIITPEGKTFGTQRRQSVTTEPEANRTDVSLDEESCDDIEEPSTSKSQPTRKRKTKKNEKNDLLSQQLKVQTELYTEVKNSLLEIVKNSRRTCYLKEEKLKLYKQELKRKAEHRNVLAQIKLDEVEIKRKKLELEEFKNKLLKNSESSGENKTKQK